MKGQSLLSGKKTHKTKKQTKNISFSYAEFVQGVKKVTVFSLLAQQIINRPSYYGSFG